MDKLRIAIVGASIAGSACGILLQRSKKFDISIFEKRAADAMLSQGAGIGFSPAITQQLKEHDLIDQDFPYLDLTYNPSFVYEKAIDQERLLNDSKLILYAVNWATLYAQLTKRLMREQVHYNSQVTAISRENDAIKLTINNHETQAFDLVIFADGYDSIGHRWLFPDSKINFANYILWRGLTPIEKITDPARFLEIFTFSFYTRGVAAIYPILGAPTLDNKDKLFINWAVYEKSNQQHPLFPQPSDAHKNIAPDKMPASYLNYFKEVLSKEFSPFIREVLAGTLPPFMQAIEDRDASAYYQDRVCLVGDAGILIRPHAGSGAVKGFQDAFELEKVLTSSNNLETDLQQWSNARCQAATQLLNLSRSVGKFFVEEAPDWNALTREEMQNGFSAALAGRHYSYSK